MPKTGRSYKLRSARFYFKVLLLNCLCLFLIVKIIKVISEPEIVLGIDDDADIGGISPFEPILKRDFPTFDHVSPRIPRIIHQTWKSVNIPPEFHHNILSFRNNNPDFVYYFWTDNTARELIRSKYPHLLETFDNYVEPVRKADMLRYKEIQHCLLCSRSNDCGYYASDLYVCVLVRETLVLPVTFDFYSERICYAYSLDQAL